MSLSRLLPGSGLVLLGLAACEGLIGADFGRDRGTDAAAPPEDGPAAQDASCASECGAGPDASSGALLYDDVQKKLEAKRSAGPTIKQGSKGYCTPRYFVWHEADGTVHSWAPSTRTRIDYGFKAGLYERPHFASDSLMAVGPNPASIDIYRTDLANSPVASIPPAFRFFAASDGIIRVDLEREDGGVGFRGATVRRWNAASGVTEDLTAVLPAVQPPSSFVNDILVIPGGSTIPYALWLVDVVKRTTASVTFEGGALQQTERGAGGLVVAYTRSGGSGAVRVYKNDQDGAGSRFELGDEVAKLPPYFVDPPSLEHTYVSRVATWGPKVIYSGVHGIWSYDLATGALAPVQLVAGKQVAVPDLMCVVRDANVLVYRMAGDTTGQVWAVPLNSLY